MASSARKALFYSFIDQYAGIVVYLVTSAIVSRLLTPEQIGVFSVTMVFIGVLGSVRDLGAGGYLVKEEELNEEKIRAALALQYGIGLFFCLACLLLSDTVAEFYSAKEIRYIMWVLAGNFLIIPCGAVYVALWRRELQFQKIAVMRFTGAVAGGGVAIALALKGHGSISLAWGAMATNFAGVVCAFLLWRGPHYILPGRRGIRSVVSFGGRLTIYSILGTISVGLPELLLGKLQDMLQTGLLSRALGLVMLFDRLVMSAVNSLVFPLFAKTLRSGGDLSSTYIRVFTIVTSLGWFFLAVLSMTAFPVIRILFGGQWDGAAAIVPVLCLAAAFNLGNNLTGALLLAKGAAGAAVRFATITSVVTLVTSAIGAYHGLEELSYSLAIAAFINLLLWLTAAKLQIGFNLTMLVKHFVSNACIAALSATPFFWVHLSIGYRGGIGDLWILIPMGVAALLIYCLANRQIDHPIYQELETALQSFRSRLG